MRALAALFLMILVAGQAVDTPMAAPATRITVSGVQLGMRQQQVDSLLGASHLLRPNEGSFWGGDQFPREAIHVYDGPNVEVEFVRGRVHSVHGLALRAGTQTVRAGQPLSALVRVIGQPETLASLSMEPASPVGAAYYNRFRLIVRLEPGSHSNDEDEIGFFMLRAEMSRE